VTDRHIHYVGHFAHDGHFADVEFIDGWARPRTLRPLEPADLRRIAATIDPTSDKWAYWAVWFPRGFLEFDGGTGEPEAIDYFNAVVSGLGCDVVEGTMRVVPRSDLPGMRGLRPSLA
jgi:hypothetical protein